MKACFFVEGASGVGKTTLIESLKGKYCEGLRIKIVDEVARILIKHGVSYGVKTKEMDYFIYLYAYINNFRLAEGEIVFFDRSIIDVIVYSRIALGKGNPIELVAFEFLHYIRKQVSGVIYIPIEFPLIADGIRSGDLNQQRLFDSELHSLLIHEIDIPVYEVRGSTIEREEKIFSIIKKIVAG